MKVGTTWVGPSFNVLLDAYAIHCSNEIASHNALAPDGVTEVKQFYNLGAPTGIRSISTTAPPLLERPRQSFVAPSPRRRKSGAIVIASGRGSYFTRASSRAVIASSSSKVCSSKSPVAPPGPILPVLIAVND